MMIIIVHRHNNDDLNLVNPDVKPADVHLCILTPRICHLKLPNKLLMNDGDDDDDDDDHDIQIMMINLPNPWTAR